MAQAASAQTHAGYPPASLAGKVAIVTGAAHGIGLEIARTFAAHGARVVVSDIDSAAATSAAAQLSDAFAYTCDVREESSVDDLIDHTLNLYGCIDVVVANAGIAAVSSLLNMSFDAWRSMMAINLDGVFLTVKHAAHAMIASQTPGSIMTMASVAALGGAPLLGHYAAAKAAVLNLTKTAALELRTNGIRVNAILPGFAETALVTENKDRYTASLGADVEAAITQAQGGFVSIEDIAAVALFLASDRSSFCTGGGYVVDGGLSAGLL